MFERVILKERAKEYIRKDLKKIAIVGLIVSVLSGAIGVVHLPIWIYAILGIISSILSVGVAKFCLNKVRGKEALVEDLTYGLNFILKAIVIHIIITLGIFVGVLFFVVPGIIFAIMTTFSFWILADDPSKGSIECIQESIRLTSGAKMAIFVTDLSFIGWYLLSAITWGVANILIAPYSSLTYAQIYLKLKDSKNGTINEENYKSDGDGIENNFDLY